MVPQQEGRGRLDRWGGCGMVNQRLTVAYRPGVYSGFAFGMGIERPPVPQRPAGHAGHGGGRRPLHPALRHPRLTCRTAQYTSRSTRNAAHLEEPSTDNADLTSWLTRLSDLRPLSVDAAERDTGSCASVRNGAKAIEETTAVGLPVEHIEELRASSRSAIARQRDANGTGDPAHHLRCLELAGRHRRRPLPGAVLPAVSPSAHARPTAKPPRV